MIGNDVEEHDKQNVNLGDEVHDHYGHEVNKKGVPDIEDGKNLETPNHDVEDESKPEVEKPQDETVLSQEHRLFMANWKRWREEDDSIRKQWLQDDSEAMAPGQVGQHGLVSEGQHGQENSTHQVCPHR